MIYIVSYAVSFTHLLHINELTSLSFMGNCCGKSMGNFMVFSFSTRNSVRDTATVYQILLTKVVAYLRKLLDKRIRTLNI